MLVGVGLVQRVARDRLAALDHAIEGAAPPAVIGRALGPRASIFGRRACALAAAPMKYMAFIDGMQRVDDHRGARQRQARRARPLAKAGEHRALILAREPGLRDPGGEFNVWCVAHGPFRPSSNVMARSAARYLGAPSSSRISGRRGERRAISVKPSAAKTEVTPTKPSPQISGRSASMGQASTARAP